MASSGPVSYLYNGNGLLTGRTTTAGTATETWDTGAGVALLLSDGTNDYLYGPNGTPIEQVTILTGAPITSSPTAKPRPGPCWGPVAAWTLPSALTLMAM